MGALFEGKGVILLLILIIVLFGAKRLPDAARGLGRSMRILKAETQGLVEGETVPTATAAAAETTAAVPPSPPAVTAAPAPAPAVTPAPAPAPTAAAPSVPPPPPPLAEQRVVAPEDTRPQA